MLGLLGLRIFEATGADITNLGEEHGHRVLRVCGKDSKVVLVPLPSAVSRAIDRAAGTRTGGSILLNSRGARRDRHAATRGLANAAGVRITGPHPHMLRHTFVTTMLHAGSIYAMSRSPSATLTSAPRCGTTAVLLAQRFLGPWIYTDERTGLGSGTANVHGFIGGPIWSL